MAARTKKRAAYGLLGLAVAVKVASSAPSPSVEVGNVTNTWQWLDPPVLVPAGEKASFNCTYDGRTITHGFASSDEMCIAYFAVTPASRSNLDAQSLAARGLPGPEGCKVQSFP